MKIKNIIFDFDGTLLDTAPVILATMRATFRELGLSLLSDEEYRATIGLRLEDIPARLFPDRPELAACYPSCYRRNFVRINAPGAALPFDGVVSTLHELRDRNYNMAVASSRSHKSLADFVAGMKLDSIFASLVGGDDVQCGKPSPEAVLSICDSHGWSVSETLVVGDSRYDILMGKSAGALTCGVTYGNGTIEELTLAAPDFLVDSFRTLLAVVV